MRCYVLVSSRLGPDRCGQDEEDAKSAIKPVSWRSPRYSESSQAMEERAEEGRADGKVSRSPW